MRNLANPRNASSEPRQSAYDKAIRDGLVKCAINAHYELTDADFELFRDALHDTEPWRITAAFERCLNELQWFPKLAEVWAKMPERPAQPETEEKKLVRDYFVPYYGDTRVHYFEYEDGSRRARIET